ncbi:FG-GAP repeat protein [Streptomyces sp. NPDC085524]|uniref:FG-GAP repeat protein n=1 Tax=Streptomyces sp. NPDC085524 TaxID=3365728 RepID=UPI0037D76D22
MTAGRTARPVIITGGKSCACVPLNGDGYAELFVGSPYEDGTNDGTQKNTGADRAEVRLLRRVLQPLRRPPDAVSPRRTDPAGRNCVRVHDPEARRS